MGYSITGSLIDATCLFSSMCVCVSFVGARHFYIFHHLSLPTENTCVVCVCSIYIYICACQEHVHAHLKVHN